MDKPIAAALVWFRRDLRVDDQAALARACRAARRVWCAFLFDRAILDPLPRRDRRVEFIRESLVGLDTELRALAASRGTQGVGLIVRHGHAADEIPALAKALGVQAVFVNHDDDPAALERDARVRGRLADAGIALHGSKDHVLFERDELLTAAGTPYGVFTPYKTAWLRAAEAAVLASHDTTAGADALAPLPSGVAAGVPTLPEIGFEATNLRELALPPGTAGALTMWSDFVQRMERYDHAREFPAVKGPSYLGPHLRFGTISPRRVARDAWQRMQGGSKGAERWLSELIWRDFFQQILYHHPRVVGHAFRSGYDKLRWEHGRLADEHFAAWCQGRTGYPLVDAAMLQLVHTGYMHNRLRMLTASFLVKHLGIDWRRGEAWFARHLNDFELASNNGGWQWAASTGCDAQPFFRIFNPVTQSRRFDAEGRFIRRYLPRLAGLPDALIHAPWLARPVELAAAGIELGPDYPAPIVDHDEARARTLQRFAAARGAAKPA